ncbi:MFS transporter [Metapseudomonas otitidis]
MPTRTQYRAARENRWLILGVIVFAYLPIMIDMTVLHIAVPSLSRSLEASGEEILWIIDIYPLVMAGLLVPMGTLADRVGNRRLLLIGLMLFTAMSVAASLSPGPEALIASRAAMAVGAAMAVPCTLAVIRHVFLDQRERSIALGIWSAIAAGGAAMGPLIGGALLEHFWWGSVFLINVPIMLSAWPLVYLTLEKDRNQSTAPWKPGQALLLIAGVLAVVYALKTGVAGGYSLSSAVVLFTGVLLLGFFIRIQHVSPHPLLDLTLFSYPGFRIGVVVALVVSGALAGTELTVAQELQLVVGRSPFQAATFLMPLIIAAVIGGPTAGYLVGWLGLRMVVCLSLLLSAVGLAGLGVSDISEVTWILICVLVVLGFGLSIGLTVSSIAIMDSAPADKAGAAGSVEATGYELGTGLGISFFGVLLNLSYARVMPIPSGIDPMQAERAGRSLGDTLLIASQLEEPVGAQLIEAGKLAFIQAHSVILLSAAALTCGLAIWAFCTLRECPKTIETN